jgi:hypothetical protein
VLFDGAGFDSCAARLPLCAILCGGFMGEEIFISSPLAVIGAVGILKRTARAAAL